MHRIFATLFAAVLVAAAMAADAARAAAIHVSTAGADGMACGAQASPCKTLNYVLFFKLTADPDTVMIGPGDFPTPGLHVNQANATGDVIQGAGSGGLPGATVLTHNNGGEDAALRVNKKLDLRSLSIRVPAGAAVARTGIALEGASMESRVTDVAVNIENASTANAAVFVQSAGTHLSRVRVTGSHVNDGVAFSFPAANRIEDSVVESGTAGSASALSAQGGALLVRRTRMYRDAPGVSFDAVVSTVDTNLTMESSLITGGRKGLAFQAAPPASVTLTARNVTMDVGAPGSKDAGVEIASIYARSTAPGAASVVVRAERSIFFEDHYAFLEAGSTLTFDCVDSMTPDQSAAPAPIGCGPANGNAVASALAMFVNSPAGDYHLKPGSPAIDGATTTLGELESATDIDGSLRLLDGNGDCRASVDRGAFEAPVPASFNPASCNPQPPENARPVLDRLSFSKASFRTKGRNRGTRLRFRLSAAATVRVTVERKLAGKRVGGKCRVPTRRNRRARGCIRYVKVGAFALTGRQGSNSRFYPGKIGRATLRTGSYRARVVASDGAGQKSAEQRASFRVVP